MLSEHRDMAAAKAFFESAKMVTGITPNRVTTDGHDGYPRAIRTTLGASVRHRDSPYLNKRLEQDHRGVKGRYGPMRGFKSPRSAGEFCRAYDELRNLLRSRSRTNRFSQGSRQNRRNEQHAGRSGRPRGHDLLCSALTRAIKFQNSLRWSQS
jgi:putative transposase